MTRFELDAIKDRVLEARTYGDGPVWQLAKDAVTLVAEVERLQSTIFRIANALEADVPEAAALIRTRVMTWPPT